VSESAVRDKPLLIYGLARNGAVRNARASRGQAASTPEEEEVERDGEALRGCRFSLLSFSACGARNFMKITPTSTKS